MGIGRQKRCTKIPAQKKTKCPIAPKTIGINKEGEKKNEILRKEKLAPRFLPIPTPWKR
jgi:hypothetical protein